VVTIASIVTSGWIIPAPFAIPPTVNPVPAASACFGPLSVVRMATAASSAPSAESAATPRGSPARTLFIGKGAPISPVERTRTSSVSNPSREAASSAVRSAFSIPGAPVAAFATPELTTTACGSAQPRCRRETMTGAAWTRLVVQTAAPTAGTSDRVIARSSAERRIPARTPLATNPLAAVTDIVI
jgi:hypothetical protein